MYYSMEYKYIYIYIIKLYIYYIYYNILYWALFFSDKKSFRTYSDDKVEYKSTKSKPALRYYEAS